MEEYEEVGKVLRRKTVKAQSDQIGWVWITITVVVFVALAVQCSG